MPKTQEDICKLTYMINDATQGRFLCSFIFRYDQVHSTCTILNMYDQVAFEGDYNSVYVFLDGILAGIGFGVEYCNWMFGKVSKVAQDRQNLCNKNIVKP